MKIKNDNKNNELIAVVKTLIQKGVITEDEIKNKKAELKNAIKNKK